ncbi:MAG: hypothetical protein AB9866_23615 [Syntrophobacteraceae bacterium]
MSLQIDKATAVRNNMLWSIINDIDYHYYTFKADFYGRRATVKTVGDLAQLGMSSAATALGGSVILSAAVTALKGAEVSVDKNYFREATTEAIFIKSDALRSMQMIQIQQKLMIQAPAYAFEEAYRDTLGLFSAGTVPTAIQGIAADAGKQKVEAQQGVTKAVEQRVLATLPVTTREGVTLIGKLTDSLAPLQADPAAAYPKVKAALDVLGVKADLSPTVALDQLQGEIRKAGRSGEPKKVQQALTKAGILN